MDTKQQRLPRLALKTETLRLLQEETCEQILGAMPMPRTQAFSCKLGCTL